MNLPALQTEVHDNAKAKGFWKASANIGEKLGLVHTEVSEAFEVYRDTTRELNDLWFRTTDGKPEGFGVELADIVIRCLDLAEYVGVDLETLVELKHSFNKGRPVMHGKRI